MPYLPVKPNHKQPSRPTRPSESQTPGSLESVVADQKKGQVHSLERIESIARYLSQFISSVPSNQARATPSAREYAHEQGECHSNLSGTQPIYVLLSYRDIQMLEGKLLTVIDAAFSDLTQRKAVKDLMRGVIWTSWLPNLDIDNPHKPNS